MTYHARVTAALSVLVPCLNEAANLPALCERVLAAFDKPGLAPWGASELVLVDDGSVDGSWELMRELAARHARVTVAQHRERRGIPAAWRTALETSTAPVVCSLDADLQYQPEDISRLWEALDRGADFVQGARRRLRSEGAARLLLSRGLNRLLNLSFGMRARDNKSTFFLCRRRHLEQLLAYRGRYRHWQCYVGAAAHGLGLKLAEVDASFVPRARGASAFGTVPLRAAAEVLADLPQALREYR